MVSDINLYCSLLDPYPEPYIFVTEEFKIHAIDLTTLLDTTVVIHGHQHSRAIAVDTVDNKLYFKTDKNIARSNTDGTGVELMSKSAFVLNMVIDWIGRRLFWINFLTDKIEVINLDGKERRIMVDTPDEKYDLAVDASLG